MTARFYIVGNWKMNQKLEDIDTFFKDLGDLGKERQYEAWLAPQAIHLTTLLEKANAFNIQVGSQNISDNDSGAHTGEISPSSLLDAGGRFTLIGHSERRSIYKESNDFINRKTLLSLEKGLTVIFCCGETLEEREKGMTESVVAYQIEEGLKDIPANLREKVVVAYEPVWAIGTGKTASPEQAEEVHLFIRTKLTDLWDGTLSHKVPLLYGGSVKPANVEGLLVQPNIDGALVGGASLKGADFRALCDAADKRSKLPGQLQG